jgi:hypothetical protein
MTFRSCKKLLLSFCSFPRLHRTSGLSSVGVYPSASLWVARNCAESTLIHPMDEPPGSRLFIVCGKAAEVTTALLCPTRCRAGVDLLRFNTFPSVMQEGLLEEVFKPFGHVQSVKLIRDKGGEKASPLFRAFRYWQTPVKEGRQGKLIFSRLLIAVAYVKFERASEAALALEALHEMVLNKGAGPKLKVRGSTEAYHKGTLLKQTRT